MKLKAAVLAAFAMMFAGTAMAGNFDQRHGHRHRDAGERWMSQHDHRGAPGGRGMGGGDGMNGERHHGLNANNTAGRDGMNGEQRDASDGRGMGGGSGMSGMQH